MIEYHDPATLAALEKCISDTFEGIAFAQILEKRKLETTTKPKGDEYCSFIQLSDPVNLRFFLMMTHDHLIECFSSVYPDMELDKVPQEIFDDFINELTNTAGGHFMSIVCPEKKDMVIGLPVHPTKEDIAGCLTPSAETTVMFYKVEDHDLYASLAPV